MIIGLNLEVLRISLGSQQGSLAEEQRGNFRHFHSNLLKNKVWKIGRIFSEQNTRCYGGNKQKSSFFKYLPVGVLASLKAFPFIERTQDEVIGNFEWYTCFRLNSYTPLKVVFAGVLTLEDKKN